MILLKCGFYYYLGMARPTDEDTTATEKIACYITDLKRRGRSMLWAIREAPELVRRQKEGGGNVAKGLCCSFCRWEIPI